jgi:5-formyltetrahydrofolate cyclo-ligase
MGGIRQSKGKSRKEGKEIKKELRTIIRALKSQYDLASLSAEICNKVLALASWQEAGTMLLYYPLPDEVDVRPLITVAFESGKRVLLPVVKGEDLELRLYEGEDSLRKGAFGIMEPTGETFAEENYDEIQLALVPGMAFDKAGHRLGRGKGYYDRLLPKLKKAKLTGVCFHFQLVDEVPAEPHDISVAEILC